jgi:hypothetical protein
MAKINLSGVPTASISHVTMKAPEAALQHKLSHRDSTDEMRFQFGGVLALPTSINARA